MHKTLYVLKGQLGPKNQKAIYQSGLFCCELSSFGDIGCRDFCLLSKMRLNDALNVVVTVPKN